MGTFNSNSITKGAPAKVHNEGLIAPFDQISVAANPTATQTYDFVKIAKGAVVVDALAAATDMDTSGAPTLAFDFGTDEDADRFAAAAALGQSAATNVVRCNLATGVNWTTTAEQILRATCTTTAAIFAAGTIKAGVFYYMPGVF